MSTKTTEGQLLHLDPSVILADPTTNSRFGLRPARIKELAASIMDRGRILENLEVEPLDPPEGKKKYRLTMGFYRYAAAELCNREGAGLLLPCTVATPIDKLDRLKTQLAENQERESQSPMDMAVSIQQLIQEGMPKPEVRKMFRRRGNKPASNSWINQVLGLLDLPKPLQKKIHDGDIDITGAFEIYGVSQRSPEKLQAVVDRIDKERKAAIEREEKEEEKFLAIQARAEEARVKEQEAIKAKEAAEAEKLAKIAEAEKAKAEAAEALKQAGQEVATDPEAAKKVAEAAKAVKAADDKLAKLMEKAKAATEASKTKAKELETAKKAKSSATPTAKKKTSATDVKKAARKEGAGKGGAMPLKRVEIMEVVRNLKLPNGESTKPQELGTALESCFNGVMTENQLYSVILKLFGLKAAVVKKAS